MSCIGATVGTLPATLYTGLYTGLYMARIRYLAEQDMRELLAQDFPECHPARGQVTVI